MTKREYYTNRATECLLASAQIPSDRDVPLHMAATYVQLAIEIEMREARRYADRTASDSCGNLRRVA